MTRYCPITLMFYKYARLNLLCMRNTNLNESKWVTATKTNWRPAASGANKAPRGNSIALLTLLN